MLYLCKNLILAFKPLKYLIKSRHSYFVYSTITVASTVFEIFFDGFPFSKATSYNANSIANFVFTFTLLPVIVIVPFSVIGFVFPLIVKSPLISAL
jgi:hypothetical protein